MNGEEYNTYVVNTTVFKIDQKTGRMEFSEYAIFYYSEKVKNAVRIAEYNENGKLLADQKLISYNVTEVDDIDPTAEAGEDRTAEVDEEINFNALDSSDNKKIISYRWNFSDGNIITGKTVKHEFKEEGTYEIKLTVIDDAGNTDTDTVTVVVKKKDDNDDTSGFTIQAFVFSITLMIIYGCKKNRMKNT